MAIESTVPSEYDPRSSIVQSVFDCRLSIVGRENLHVVQVSGTQYGISPLHSPFA